MKTDPTIDLHLFLCKGNTLKFLDGKGEQCYVLAPRIPDGEFHNRPYAINLCIEPHEPCANAPEGVSILYDDVQANREDGIKDVGRWKRVRGAVSVIEIHHDKPFQRHDLFRNYVFYPMGKVGEDVHMGVTSHGMIPQGRRYDQDMIGDAPPPVEKLPSTSGKGRALNLQVSPTPVTRDMTGDVTNSNARRPARNGH